MIEIPQEAFADAVHAYGALARAIFEINHHEDPDGFRREVELAQAYLREIALRMGWQK